MPDTLICPWAATRPRSRRSTSNNFPGVAKRYSSSMRSVAWPARGVRDCMAWIPQTLQHQNASWGSLISTFPAAGITDAQRRARVS